MLGKISNTKGHQICNQGVMFPAQALLSGCLEVFVDQWLEVAHFIWLFEDSGQSCVQAVIIQIEVRLCQREADFFKYLIARLPLQEKISENVDYSSCLLGTRPIWTGWEFARVVVFRYSYDEARFCPMPRSTFIWYSWPCFHQSAALLCFWLFRKPYR